MRNTLPRLLLALVLSPALLSAQKDPTFRSWNRPVAPFRIAGNLYYVGASGVAAYLFTSPQGHVLLDGGFAETAPLIRRSVERLGFRMKDVKILLSTHAHADHAGGLAALRRQTGAKLLASERDTPLLAHGGKGDFLFGDSMTFPPVNPDGTLRDGQTVTLGETRLTAHLTPGHTPGCTSWTTRIADGGRDLDVLITCSTTINPGTVLLGNPKYPAIAADYAHSFEVLKALPCDLFLAPHGNFFDLEGKAARLGKGEKPNPFVDPQGWRDFLQGTETKFQRQLAAEKAAAGGKPAAR